MIFLRAGQGHAPLQTAVFNCAAFTSVVQNNLHFRTRRGISRRRREVKSAVERAPSGASIRWSPPFMGLRRRGQGPAAAAAKPCWIAYGAPGIKGLSAHDRGWIELLTGPDFRNRQGDITTTEGSAHVHRADNCSGDRRFHR